MSKYRFSYEFDTLEELIAFIDKNKGGSGDAPPKKAGRPSKSKDVDPGDIDLGEEELSVDEEELSLEAEPDEEATLENIRRMVSTKALDKSKKGKIIDLLKKSGVESATKLPPAKYKAFFDALKKI